MFNHYRYNDILSTFTKASVFIKQNDFTRFSHKECQFLVCHAQSSLLYKYIYGQDVHAYVFIEI